MNISEKKRADFLLDLLAVCRKHKVSPENLHVTLTKIEKERLYPNITKEKE